MTSEAPGPERRQFSPKDRFAIDDGPLHLNQAEHFMAWSREKKRYVQVPDELVRFASCFGKKEGEMVRVSDALDRMRENFELDEEDEAHLVSELPKLVECRLLRWVDAKRDHKFFVKQETDKVPNRSDDFRCVPTFLVGAPRSGTTLYTSLVNAHPNIHCSSEARVVENVLDTIARNTKQNTPSPSWEWAALNGETGIDLVHRYAKFVDDLFSDIAARAGKKRWIDKMIYVHRKLDLIDRLFDCRTRFVVLSRHAFDSGYSMGEGKGEIPPKFRKRNGMQVLAGVDYWCEYYQEVLKFSRRVGDRCAFFKYEDLVTDPQGTAERLFTHLGEAYSPDIFEELERGPRPLYSSGSSIRGTIDKRALDRWKSWPDELKKQMGEMANETLEAMGYEPVG